MIPVLDLSRGRAVQARGGERDAYAPVRSVLLPEGNGGDPLALGRAFRDVLGCDACYVADLDAIAGGTMQRALLSRLVTAGGALWIDAGVTDARRAEHLIALGAARVIVGLETLSSFHALTTVLDATGAGQLVFSLDLRDGVPIVLPGAAHRGTPLDLADAAVDAGATSLLVLDLARVGSGRGVDAELVRVLRRAHPAVELLAGGGLGAGSDLGTLADLGLDGVLVATALHDGRIRRADVEAARRRQPSDSR